MADFVGFGLAADSLPAPDAAAFLLYNLLLRVGGDFEGGVDAARPYDPIPALSLDAAPNLISKTAAQAR